MEIMAFRFQQTSNFTKMVIIAEFFLVSYLLYSLTVSVYKSYQIDQHIKSFEEENAKIEEGNRKRSEEFDYYSSDAYIEKMAKQNLGLVNPGEEVIIIPNNEDITAKNGALISGGGDEGGSSSLSNPQKWWNFFFDLSA
jgi:cell division protein FtsB